MRTRIASWLIGFLCLAAPSPVFADFTIVQRTTFDLSQVTVMGSPASAETLDMIKKSPLLGGANGLDITIQASGDNVRCDTPIVATIVDMKKKEENVLFPKTRQYMVSDLPTNQIAEILAGATAVVTDAKQKKTILGHEAHLYNFTIENALVTITGGAWLAADLPELPGVALSASNPLLGYIQSQVKGFPLETAATVDMQALFGKVSLRCVANRLSTDPIPAAAFAVPSDYTKTDTAPPGTLDLGVPDPSQLAPGAKS